MKAATEIRMRLRRRSARRGFALMTGIFLLLVLGVLALGLVAIYGVQQQQSALDEQGARAYQAARAGIEWGLYRQLRAGAACDGSTTSFMLPAGSTLSSYGVSVTCVQTPPGAVTAITRCLAVELGTRNPKVRVNQVNPGPVMLPPDLPDAEKQQAINATLVKREGSPANAALAVLALVDNDFVTGVCLPVDGGRTVYAPEGTP